MKTIALIEIGNDGHREAYMNYFIGALLDLECRVICLIPDTAPIQNWVSNNYPGKQDRVTYCNLPYYRNKFSGAGRLKERFNLLYNWYQAGKTIRELKNSYHLNTDLVFFNFLDAFLLNYTPHVVLDQLLGKKWSGIYFFPAFLRLQPSLLNERPNMGSRDHILTSPNCVAVGFHDADIRQQFSARLGGKPVLLFPEIADLSVPDETDALRQEILLNAKGRLVVGNIGLEKHKGNYEMMRLAKIADPGAYFFVFTGRDDGTLFDFLNAEQTAELKAFIRNLPENCLWHPAVFCEGAQYNTILSSFDIVYVIYTHFYGASNRLTKAAHFQKLILADDKYCIGDAVKKYDLGEAVTDTRPETLLAALQRLKQRLENGDLPADGWAAYLAGNNFGNLRRQFRELLDLV